MRKETEAATEKSDKNEKRRSDGKESDSWERSLFIEWKSKALIFESMLLSYSRYIHMIFYIHTYDTLHMYIHTRETDKI
jgi:hypothetical protein